MNLHVCIYTLTQSLIHTHTYLDMYTHTHTHTGRERERNTLSYDKAYIQTLSNSKAHRHTYTRTYAPRTVTLNNACDNTNLSWRDAQTSAHRSDGGVG